MSIFHMTGLCWILVDARQGSRGDMEVVIQLHGSEVATSGHQSILGPALLYVAGVTVIHALINLIN